MLKHESASLRDGYLLDPWPWGTAPYPCPEAPNKRPGHVFFAIQIDYPNKLNPAINVTAFCERWKLSDGGLYKALGDFRKKSIVVSISSQLNLQLS